MARRTVTPECVALDDMADQFKLVHKLDREIAKREAAKKLIITAIKTRMGDSTRATLNGRDAVLWGRTVRQQIDIPALRVKYPDVADACVKLVEVRSFKIVDQA